MKMPRHRTSDRRTYSHRLSLQRLESRLLLDGTVVDWVSDEFDTGDAPVGAVAADFNDDGVLDVAVANSLGDSVSVLLGNGDGTFQDAVTYSAGDKATGIAAGDVDGDGLPDLVVANSTAGDVSVLLNNGDGTFADAVDYTTGSTPTAVALGFLDGDAVLDMVVTNWSQNSVSIFIGNGDGTFQDDVTYDVGSRPSGVALADLDGDGFVDVVTANENSDDISVLIGLGDGTFADSVDVDAGDNPNYLAIGDLNGDALPDVVVTNDRSDDVSVLIGNGDGTFADAVGYGVGQNPIGIALGDFDDDGNLDVAVANSVDDDMSVLLGNGDGTLQDERLVDTGNNPQYVIAGDFNGDDLPDLVVSNYYDDNILLLTNDGTHLAPVATIELRATTDTGEFDDDGITNSQVPQVVVTTNMAGKLEFDWDGDGVVDTVRTLASASSVNVTPSISLPDGTHTLSVTFSNEDVEETDTRTVDVTVDLTPPRVAQVTPSSVSYVPVETIEVVFDDANGMWLDTVTDSSNYILLASGGDGSFSEGNEVDLSGSIVDISFDRDERQAVISVGEPLAFEAYQLTIVSADAVKDVAGTQLDGDGDGLAGGDHVATFIVRSDGTVAGFTGGDYAVGFRPSDVAIADFDGDTHPDLAVANSLGDNVTILLAGSGGTFITGTTFDVGDEPVAVVAAMLNDDEYVDIAVVTADDDSVVVCLGNGDGTFQAGVAYATGGKPQDIAVDDFDGDGDMDLAVTNFDDGDVSVLLGNGDGTFGPAWNLSIGIWARGVTTGDFNEDAVPDIVAVAYGDDAVVLLAGNGDGTFAAPSVFATGDGPFRVASGDLDGDGHLDLAVTNEREASVSILLGDGAGDFADGGKVAVGEDPMAILVADVNGDGDADILVANERDDRVQILFGGGDGTFAQTALLPAGRQPQGLALGDLNGDGLPDVVATNYDSDTVTVFLNDGPRIEPQVVIDLRGSSDSGESVEDDLTSDSTPTFDVSLNQAGTLNFDWDGDGTIDKTQAVAGAGIIQVTASTLSDGVYPVLVSFVTDGGVATTSLPVTIDTKGATVVSMTPSGTGIDYKVGTIEVEFSDANALWQSTVLDLANYELLAAGNDSNFTSGNEADVTHLIQDAVYDEETKTVTFTLSAELGDDKYQLKVFGDATVRDAAGNALDGDKNNVRGGNYTGTFTVASGGNGLTFHAETIEEAEGAYAVGAGDFNGDGIMDVVSANSARKRVLIYFGNGDGTFELAGRRHVGSLPYDIQVADLNGDGLDDVAVVNVLNRDVSILLSKGNGKFKRHDERMGKDPVEVVLFDVNDDGNLDLLTADSGQDTVSVRLGQGNGRFGPRDHYSVGLRPNGVAAGDLDGDGLVDLIAANTGDGEVTILPGVGEGRFSEEDSVVVESGSSTYDVAVADFDDDGRMDFAVANYGDGKVAVFYGQEDGEWDVRRNYATSSQPIDLTVGDFDSDGMLDIAVASWGGAQASVLFGHAGGGFGRTNYTVGTRPRHIVVADLNDDGRPDLLTSNNGDETVSALLGEPLASELFDSVSIRQVVDHGDPFVDDDTSYLFELIVRTDSSVEGLDFISADGGTFEFSTADHTVDGEVQTWYAVDGDDATWTWLGVFDDEDDLDVYGDGDFEFVAHIGTFEVETTVLFGKPDTPDPIKAPTVEPTITGPAHESILRGPLDELTWEESTDLNAQSVYGRLVAPDGTEWSEDFGIGETAWDIDVADLGQWDFTVGFLNAYDGENDDGIAFDVSKATEGHSGFTLMDSVADVVGGLGVEQVVNYNRAGEDATYDVRIEVTTVPGVDLVEIITPDGDRFQIARQDEVLDGDITTRYVQDAESAHWFFLAAFDTMAEQAAFADGVYDFDVTIPSEILQTSALFGVPGTAQPIGAPLQEPVITGPDDVLVVESPLDVEWLAVTDPEATSIGVLVEDATDGAEVLSDRLDVGEGGLLSVDIADGSYDAVVSFANRFVDVNADGIDVTVGRSTESRQAFRVITPEGIWESDGVRVAVYDMDDTADVSPEDVAVHFGRNGVVKAITLVGESAMSGLGIVVSGATVVNRVTDERTGELPDMAFIAVDAPLKTLALQSGLLGLEMNGLSFGGIDLAPDMDGDGATDDTTSIYVGGPVKRAAIWGSVSSDTVIAGDVNLFDVTAGDLGGDLVLTASTLKNLSVTAVYDEVTREWIGGDVDGDVSASGNILNVIISGGDVNGNVTSEAGMVRRVEAHVASHVTGGLKGGSISGDIISARDIVLVTADGGNLDGNLTAVGGVKKVSVRRAYDAVATELVGGSMNGDLTAGAGVKRVSVDENVTGRFEVSGGMARLDVGANLDGAELHVTHGLKRVGVGGNAEGTVIEVDGLFNRLDVVGNFLNSGAEATRLGRVSVGGLIVEDDSDGEDIIRATQGSFVAGDVTWKGVIDAENDQELGGVRLFVGPADV